MDQWEREEDDIEQRYADGLISARERNEEIRELHRDYRAAAEEAAERAYDREMECW